jgi:hypothetical protein
LATEGTAKITSGLELTKDEVRRYYARPDVQKKLLPFLRGQDLLVGQSPAPNQIIYKRYDKGNPIRVNSPKELERYGDRRHTEFHPVIGAQTNKLWVDLDSGSSRDLSSLKPLVPEVEEALRKMPQVKNTSIAFSGGRGFYIRGELDKHYPTGEIREKLKAAVKDLAKNRDDLVVDRPPHLNEVRLDISTFHDKGSIRAPHALNSATGFISMPLTRKQLQGFDPVNDANPRKLASDKAPLIFYHGTRPALLAKIQKEGLLPEMMGTGWEGDPKARAYKAVSLTTRPEHAMAYAQLGAGDEEGKGLLGMLLSKPSILKIQIPKTHHRHLEEVVPGMTHGGFDEWHFRQAIPPEWITLEKLAAAKEFAPGIPAARTTHPLPELNDKTWTMAIQLHNAERAGKHWDLRLVDPNTTHAHSWAVPKAKLPSPLDPPVLAIHTPTHTAHYALNYGVKGPSEIKSGYGKGMVEMVYKEPVNVLSSSIDKIKFERKINGLPQQFVLFQTKGQSWMLKNVTKTTKEANMTPFQLGRYQALQKLGLAETSTNRPSTLEAPMPLDTEDENMPAGQLAAALSQIPEQMTQSKALTGKGENVEGHLNRNTVWSEPHPISNEMATGPSPVMPGRF